jgi:hypothetical protein
MMTQIANIGIPVQASTAEALAEARKREPVRRLIDWLLPPTDEDPLVQLFAKTAADAQAAGMTDAEIEEELAAYNAERRD